MSYLAKHLTMLILLATPSAMAQNLKGESQRVFPRPLAEGAIPEVVEFLRDRHTIEGLVRRDDLREKFINEFNISKTGLGHTASLWCSPTGIVWYSSWGNAQHHALYYSTLQLKDKPLPSSWSRSGHKVENTWTDIPLGFEVYIKKIRQFVKSECQSPNISSVQVSTPAYNI